eukprot:TRINITY_DN14320_c1_g1_i1.p1 TRINITY_DN14320_c1_g1~~TRINITY_DN14320_c1_g1_i1.p1  ORF type:complete len:473 (+),score=59.34 TRINITY_DN14320_c1_g1_i1:82-1500(+)
MEPSAPASSAEAAGDLAAAIRAALNAAFQMGARVFALFMIWAFQMGARVFALFIIWCWLRGHRDPRAAAGELAEWARAAAADARDWLQPGRPAAAVRNYHAETGEVTIATELASDFLIAQVSHALDHTALLTAGGAVLCEGHNTAGQLGVGHRARRRGPVAARLPWRAAAVNCGLGFTVALRRGGTAVCSWGHHPKIGRDGDTTIPAEVPGLPNGDPVALLKAGGDHTIAVTESDEAYGWGENGSGELALSDGDSVVASPICIAALSGRGLRRLACGAGFSVAETRRKELLCWGKRLGRISLPTSLFGSEGVAFPLRDLATALTGGVAAADALGRLWCSWSAEGISCYAHLPPGERVARVAGTMTRYMEDFFVALTVHGALWHCRWGGARRITAARAPLQVLLPCGGPVASRIILSADLSCGLARCRLLLLAAGRRGLLPGGQIQRVAIIPFLVAECSVFDEHGIGDGAMAI